MIRYLLVLVSSAVCTTAWAVETLDDCRVAWLADREQGAACYLRLTEGPSRFSAAESWRAIGSIALANRAYRDAVAEQPDDPDIRVGWARLFLDAHQLADAEALSNEALELDPSHVGARLMLAEIALDRYESRAMEIVDAVLSEVPDNADAKLLKAQLALQVGDVASARGQVEGMEAAQDPQIRIRAMSLLAAIDISTDRVPSPWVDRALEISPHYGELFEASAYFYIIGHRYTEAVEMLQRAVALDPNLWTAHATLGINLLRVNRFDDARVHLNRAHEGDPYNAQVVNTLRLLDSLDQYELNVSEGLELRVHQDEAGALTPYVEQLVRDGIATFATRYGYQSQSPVVLELYPHHDDFAVRTSGLPGIGILGAAFGDVVVMDSPSARTIDDGFDWASALWHELAHVVTLGATGNRVSRWFSEGVSVFEEWHTGPTQTRSIPLPFVRAFEDGRLLPVADLDSGFIRPTFENQVIVSYLQAGLLCEHIAEAHGQQALERILQGYREGLDTPGAIEQALGESTQALDSSYEDYLTKRFEGISSSLFETALTSALEAADAEDWATVATAAQQAVDAYPGYAGDPNPYPLLAKAKEELGGKESAIADLLTYWQSGGRQPSALAHLVEILEESERVEEAVEVRRSLALVAPLDPDTRAVLGDRLMDDHRFAEAFVEYQAHLSLAPHDMANAHYRVARALKALDRTGEARQHVLYALEIAPRFDEALALLVEISE